METKANYVLVGVFTVLILVMSFGFVYWSANVSDQDSEVDMLVRIEGSVTGLSVGSQVLFNGLRVGDVRSLRIDPNNPRIVIASTKIEATTPITPSTRATIGFAGLTGQAFIELKGGDVTERNIIDYARQQGAVPVIKADPSDVTDILATAKDISERANNILTQFEGIVGDIGPAVKTTASNISETSENVKIFTDSLANNSGGVNDFLSSISRLANTANTVAESLPGAIRSAQNVIEAVDPKAVNTTVTNIAAMSETLREGSDKIAGVVDSFGAAAASVGNVGETLSRNTAGIERFVANLGPISDSAAQVAAKLDTSLGSAEKILAAVDPADISRAVGDLSSAARNVTEVSGIIGAQGKKIGTVIANASDITGNIKVLTETFSGNRDQIDRFVASLGPISENAASASAKLSRTIDDAGQIISGIDRNRVSQAVDGVAAIVSAFSAKTPEVQSIIDGVDRTIRTVDTTIGGFNGTRERVDGILQGIDPATVTRAITNVSSATDNVARAADSIAGVANDIGGRRDDINRIITNAQETSAKVNTASSRLDTVLASVDKLLNSSSTDGLLVEASATLKTIREAAASIQAQIRPIAANIQRFSGDGLSEVRGLVRDVSRSVNRIEGAVTDFQANPSRLIFGGDEVKQYDGRNRR